jgi:HrpA-like RNA helicase
MSATLQEEKFSQYFGNCPVLYVSGRTFPVNIHFLADCHRLLNKKKLNPKGNIFSILCHNSLQTEIF